MSRSLRRRESRREIAFGIGAFVGMVTFAIGVATLVLAMSVGLRRGQDYLPTGARTAILAVGAALLLGGVLLRLYRGRLSAGNEDRLATGGLVAALLGVALFLFGAAAETTVSAPFLTSPREKVLLFLIAYVLIAAGLLVLRRAAKIVGW